MILHVLCTGLFRWLLVTLGLGSLMATLIATVFAVHPALTGSIAWIPGRNDTLMTAFALVSRLAFSTG